MDTLINGNKKINKYINNKKVVIKPWGKEIWLELNDKYCYKRIHINAGFKTSYQIHNFKHETNYIIKGEAEIWLENDNNIVEKFIMSEGDFFTVIPKRKHRVIAITDIILQEVSTPEVDDVIRLDDEFNRGNGRIQSEHFKPVVCIIAAGIGSRLGSLSKTYHKTLLPLNYKAIISHIIEKFDSTFEIIISVGHLKEQIIEYIKLYHNDKDIKIINVDPYVGKGSGPAFSLECCRKELQRPFYFCVSDFYTEENLQNNIYSNRNWISVKDTDIPELYSTINIKNGKVVNIINKNKIGYNKAFTGIFYMYDYKLFWEQFDKNVDDNKEIIDIFKDVQLFNFEPKEISWNDMGTLDLYYKLIELYEEKNLHLHKTKHEYKYRKDNIFIKAGNEEKINKIFYRSEYLKEYIPKLLYKGKYFFSYEYFNGNTLYQLDNNEIYLKYIQWFEEYFCKKIYIDKSNFLKDYAYKFYNEKTFSRLDLFKSKNDFLMLDSINEINNKKVLTINKYLEKIDWDLITNTIPIKLFHGDLQFDNIIYNGEKFKLIDWREDFGGNIEYGDLYYDLAKLYGGMILNYLKMKDTNNYSYIIIKHRATITNYIDKKLEKISENEFKNLVERNNLDLNKIKLITAIIFLNMSPLHINKFDKFLFFKSKLLFNECLNT